MPNENRRLAAIMVADIVGYTGLMERDTDGTIAAWRAARTEVIEPGVSARGGRIVKYTGDGFLAEFQSLQNAVECALKLQDDFTSSSLEFRIGINLGDIVEDDNDIYGEGINIAARIEPFAEPGGICVTEVVKNIVRNRISIEFEELAPQALKNVSTIINIYRVVPVETAPANLKAVDGSASLKDPSVNSESQPTSQNGPNSDQGEGMLGLPAVAVLPFNNMSADQEQEYFADGITEDIITELTKGGWFPVIARNSTFAFKGQKTDTRDVAQELDAAYIVEGSVRKSANKIRVTAKLIDAATGQQMWAERYDRDLLDIFEVQDEITMNLVGAVMPELYVDQQKIAFRKPPGNLAAWDLMLKAQWHHAQFTADSFAEARILLFQAIDLDPSLPMVHALISDIALWGLSMGWRENVEEALAEAATHSSKALSLEPSNAHARACLSWVELFSGNPQQAREAADKAIQDNPSYAVIRIYCGNMYVILGEAELALEHYEVMRRLSPRDPLSFVADSWEGLGNYVLGDYARARDFCQKSLRQNANFTYTYLTLIAAYGQLGLKDEALKYTKILYELAPELSEQLVRICYPFPDKEIYNRFLDGLKKAGLV